MTDDEIMFILESIAYISASIAALVYIWETCFITKFKILNKRHNSSDSDSKSEERVQLRSSVESNGSLFDDFNN
jgi:hypothetical protein